ncbi:kinase-like protein [Auriculariales sp. MPI-PUGE-AT-0066]|nr:kinase-like protein [Auriculariales sp. MPI-PUGE-AT-0066]
MLGTVVDGMRAYRARKDASRRSVVSKYTIEGFISSGTYGRVYKAKGKDDAKAYAIKKFKPDKEGEATTYTGISQSAIREIALNREIQHENVVALREVILEDKSIYMVFEYADHDFLQVIHHHSHTMRFSIPMPVLKSLTYQLLKGLVYLHNAHILHRDLKPANILITSAGQVKIGDLGLARLVHQPLQHLTVGDKIVVTIWYRAPELLLGAKHYNKAIDCWAVGCVLAELVSLRPIFKGEEAKMDSKKTVPFQKDQFLKIVEVLGTPNEHHWPSIGNMPEYRSLQQLDVYTDQLLLWCQNQYRSGVAFRNSEGAHLLQQFFIYDPDQRVTAAEALQHKWFTEDPKPNADVFESILPAQHPPPRRLSPDDAPSMVAATSQQFRADSRPASIPHSRLEANRVGPSIPNNIGTVERPRRTKRQRIE